MRRFILLFIAVWALVAVQPIRAQDTDTPIAVVVTVILVWPTATETPEPTEGPSPTPTETPTRTPHPFMAESTVEVDGTGQDVAFVYQADVGQLGIILFLAFISGLLLLVLLFGAKR